jgi:cytidine deaminase
MMEPSNKELIDLAVDVLNPIQVDEGRWTGDVAAALVTESGNVYKGVCMDPGSGIGFCAERAAIAQMLTNKEYKVKRIVAVWNNNTDKQLYVLAPCGACREYMKQVCKDGLEIDVILSNGRTNKLRELLPEHEWPEAEV